MLAVGGRIAGLVDRRFREGGASTLATQIDKFRHSPSGRTPGGIEELRQMATASARAYRDGPRYEGSAPHDCGDLFKFRALRLTPRLWRDHRVSEGLWLWYGTELAEADRVLSAPAVASAQLARKG